MDKSLDIQKKIEQEEDYIRCPKFSNSLQKFLAKNPDGVDDKTIARLLMIPEEQVEKLYQESVKMLRKDMVHDDKRDS